MFWPKKKSKKDSSVNKNTKPEDSEEKEFQEIMRLADRKIDSWDQSVCNYLNAVINTLIDNGVCTYEEFDDEFMRVCARNDQGSAEARDELNQTKEEEVDKDADV